MLSYETIAKFVKNIYYAKDRKFNEDFLPMWIREILITGADVKILQQAEAEIIREDIAPKIKDVCDVIMKHKRAVMIPLTSGDCRYCGGKGYVYANLYFDKTGKFLSSNYTLACVCNQKPITIQMQLNSDNNKTETENGYFRCFSDSVQQDQYLKKVIANNWRDIR